MDEDEDLGILREVRQRAQAVHVVFEVDLELLRRHIKDKNEHADVLEDVVSLRLKVLFHEPVLTATIPQRQDQVAKEAHPLLVHIDSEGYFVGVTRQVVRENN